MCQPQMQLRTQVVFHLREEQKTAMVVMEEGRRIYYLSCCYDKILGRYNLKGGRVILAHGLRVITPSIPSWHQGMELTTGLPTYILEDQETDARQR